MIKEFAPMAKKRLIIVSNRLPLSISKLNGQLVYTPSAGGLATAMASMQPDDETENLWIGWPGIADEDLAKGDKTKITKVLKKNGCVPVFLTKKQIELFYEGYSNDTLWPVFHHFQSYAEYKKIYWKYYRLVNIQFKNVVERQITKKSAIWIHDYHLMLLPNLLRMDHPKATIGFFLHIPFPSYEIFRLLPNRKDILTGLLGANLVGFHIYDYARHFLSSALRILGLDSNHGLINLGERIVRTDAFPIGIDYQKFVKSLEDPKVIEQRKMILKHHAGQKILLSVDRLDYTKGILKRLEGFEKYLAKHPEKLGKVHLIIIVVPSRVNVERYKDLRDDINRYIGHINGRFGSVGWSPVSYQFKNLPFHEIVALYAESDIALVTPLSDGMNLVAKEYIACKQNKKGVLILSEMAGAIDELPEALRINPNNIDAIVQAIEYAIDMPKKEQAKKLYSMQRRLSLYDIKRWADDFISELNTSNEMQRQHSGKLLSKDAELKIIRLYKKATKRLIILDYDGTLKKFVESPDPDAAAPDEELYKLIVDLSSRRKTKVAIVSGRTKSVLERWFGKLPVSIAAEHGAWVKYNGSWSHQQFSLGEYKKKVLDIMNKYAERTPGAIVEEKEYSIVWHYRLVPTELAHARNASLRHDLNQILHGSDIDIHSGSKIIEVKPHGINKGFVAEELLAVHKADFVLCMGDDYTDEDMFQALPDEAFTIKVGVVETSARFQVHSVDEALSILKSLN